MKNREIKRQLDSLRDLISRSSVASGGDVEMQAHWAKYICVLVAGLLENALPELYGDFVRRTASPPVASYVIRELGKIQNPRPSKFVEVARGFRESWGDDLQSYLDTDGRGDAI